MSLVSVDGQRVDVDEVVVVTGFRPDHSWLSEVHLDLDGELSAPVALAPEIHPAYHSCGSVSPHGANLLRQPEGDLYLVGMKSYGRAPSFLTLTGYEQTRSVVAEIAGDHEAAARVELVLPDTGVCGGSGLFDESADGGCCAPAATAPQLLTIGAAAAGQATPAAVVRLRLFLSCCGTGVLHPRPRPPSHLRRRPPARGGGPVRDRDHQLGCTVLRLPRRRRHHRGRPGLVANPDARRLHRRADRGGPAGVWVGRHIDAVGPRALMTLAILGAVAMVGVASSRRCPRSTSPGPSQASRCRPPSTHPPSPPSPGGPVATSHRVRAITAVTLVAGLASTVFAPLTAWLLEPLGWRAPTRSWPARRRDRSRALGGPAQALARSSHAVTTPAPAHRTTQPSTFRPGDFRLLVAAMALAGFCVPAVVVNLVPLLLENGLSLRTAATVMGVGGIGQVAGRLFYHRLARFTGPGVRTWVILGGRPDHGRVRGDPPPVGRRAVSPSSAAWPGACSPSSKPPPSPTAGDRRPTVRATGSSAARRWAPQHSLPGRGRSWQTTSAASPRRSGCWPWAWWSRPQASDPQQAGAFLDLITTSRRHRGSRG